MKRLFVGLIIGFLSIMAADKIGSVSLAWLIGYLTACGLAEVDSRYHPAKTGFNEGGAGNNGKAV